MKELPEQIVPEFMLMVGLGFTLTTISVLAKLTPQVFEASA